MINSIINRSAAALFTAALTFCIVSAMTVNAADIYLTDGRIISGHLVQLSKSKAFIDTDFEHFAIDMRYINAIITGADSDGCAGIRITLSNGTTQDGDLVMIGHSSLMYKTRQNIDALSNIRLKQISHLTVIGAENVSLRDYEPLAANDISDILSVTQLLLDVTSDAADDSISAADSSDFYDKYWLKMGGRIDRDTGSLLWNLIDLYTEKEQSLTLIYNEKLNSDKSKSEIQMSVLSQELQSKICELRYSFAYRAYMIIIRHQQTSIRPETNEVSYGIVW